eukprot:TRINITY_DN2839_c0_g1_i6.p1 TRINITY_DN2839_c0_g1~~TRINITY_DN2839_c0_g1_i6.p1  ORF type:complete len:241 (+),score=10.65 TRINITY_DN2839_c0_g1_i6:85-807(+)
MLAYLSFTFVVLAYVRERGQAVGARPLLHVYAWEESRGLLRTLCRDLCCERGLMRTYVASAIIMIFVILLFILINLRLDGVIEWKATAVFTPFYAIGIMLLLTVPFGCFERSERWSFTVIVWLLYFPVLAAVIAILVRIDGGTYPLHLAFIPLWILDGAGLILGIVVVCISICDRDSDGFILGYFTFLLACVITFEALLCVWSYNGSITFLQCLIPLLVGLGSLFCISIIALIDYINRDD